MTWLTFALESVRRSQHVAVARVMGPNGHAAFGEALVFDGTGTPISPSALRDWPTDVTLLARTAVATQTVQRSRRNTGAPDVVVMPFGPPSEAWIFGAGHIAQALSPLLARLGWRVVVCDDRDEYVTSPRFPDAGRLIAESFPTCAEQCAEKPYRWVVLVTRGHQHDEQILRRLGEAQTRYIGMIGSKRRVQAVRDRLKAQGLPERFTHSIHAPIGIPIGADSPAEIAVSIAAELIAVRHRVMTGGPAEPFPADTSNAQSLWESIATVMASGRPVALATIIDRRGSTPRGLGAQMAIYADGSISGTIGGGCGEEEIRQAARHLLLEGGHPRLVEVDLTGDPASETSADVCGGRYTVMLERLSKPT